MRYTTVLFDLDGTLTDPKLGITKSVQYALARFGIHELNLDTLEPFIGPPLAESFPAMYGFDDEQTQTAIRYYREYFSANGLFENALYPGIPALLQALKQTGKTLMVATSKPTAFAIPILKHFQIYSYFDFVAGSNLDGTRATKTEVIQYALSEHPSLATHHAVMVGDRKHDIIGAHNTGLASIGVTYGYGSVEELEQAEPTCLVDSVEALMQLLTA